MIPLQRISECLYWVQVQGGAFVSMQKRNTFSNAEQGSPIVERKCFRSYLVCFWHEGEKKIIKNHTYTDRTQYRNIKFLLWNCCQVRHFIKNYNRVSMTACLNAEKGPLTLHGLNPDINSNSVKRLEIRQWKLSELTVQSFPFSIVINSYRLFTYSVQLLVP